MSDFESALHIAIKNNQYMKEKVIHIKCFFYFTKND